MNRRRLTLFISNYAACCIVSASTSFGYHKAIGVFPKDIGISMNEPKQDLKQAKTLYAKALILYNDPDKTESTIQILTEAKNILVRYDSEKIILFDVYLKLGVCYYDTGNNYDALKELQNARDLQSKHSLPADALFFDLCVTLGDVFRNLYQYDSAAYYYNYVESNLKTFQGLRPHERQRIYNALGALNYSHGDNKLALNYYEKSLQECLKVFSPDAQEIVNVQSNIASSLLKLGKYNEAIQRYRALLPHQKSISTLYQNLGKAYQEIKQFDSSLMYLHKAEQIASSDGLKIKLFNNLGITYAGLNEDTQALEYIDRAVVLNKSVYRTKNVALAFSHINKGKILEKQGKLTAGLKEYQEALKLLHNDFTSDDIYQNPEDISRVISATYFFECLTYKAGLLRKLYTRTSDHKNLTFSFATYKLAIEVVDYIRKRYASDETKLFFMNIVNPVYEAAIEASLLLHNITKNNLYKELAFSFSEKAKMAVLSEALIGIQFKDLRGIPPPLIARESSVKRSITRLLAKLQDTRDSLQLSLIRKDISENEIQLSSILKALESHQEYYDLKYNFEMFHPKDIQQHLQKHAVCIEYYQGDSYLFIFTITVSEITAVKIPRTIEYKNAIEGLKKSLYDFEEGSKYQGEQYASVLYNYLIKPIETQLAGKRKILIIPDGELNYIPFESLTQDDNSSHYMIYDYTINYAFSGLYLNYSKRIKIPSFQPTILSMAPFSEAGKTSDGFRPLMASLREVSAMDGKVYSNQAATKSKFTSSSNSFDIIHLATHAKAYSEEPQNSYIAFFPQGAESMYKLFMPEIYNLQLDKVKLIVISACEVGTGKFMRGEGIMSMSRAFAFAGASSIITSLWNADDDISATIMTGMHAYLKDGYEKDEALRNAKLDFLKSDQSQQFKTPVFWANFMLVGDNSPLYEKYNPFFYPLILVVAGVFFYALFRRRYLKTG